MTELECVSSQANAVHTHKTELNQTIQELEATLKKKEEVRSCMGSLTHKAAFEMGTVSLWIMKTNPVLQAGADENKKSSISFSD